MLVFSEISKTQPKINFCENNKIRSNMLKISQTYSKCDNKLLLFVSVVTSKNVSYHDCLPH